MASSSPSSREATIIQAPTPLPPASIFSPPVLFLSGSILPTSPGWQETISNSLTHLSITILNPLRPDWDSSWIEDISFPPFHEQVKWELNGLERADIVAVFFAKGTLAAITLMELGLFIQSGKRVVVACEEGFWKRGNVQVVCERFGVRVLGSLDELTKGVKDALEDEYLKAMPGS